MTALNRRRFLKNLSLSTAGILGAHTFGQPDVFAKSASGPLPDLSHQKALEAARIKAASAYRRTLSANQMEILQKVRDARSKAYEEIDALWGGEPNELHEAAIEGVSEAFRKDLESEIKITQAQEKALRGALVEIHKEVSETIRSSIGSGSVGAELKLSTEDLEQFLKGKTRVLQESKGASRWELFGLPFDDSVELPRILASGGFRTENETDHSRSSGRIYSYIKQWNARAGDLDFASMWHWGVLQQIHYRPPQTGLIEIIFLADLKDSNHYQKHNDEFGVSDVVSDCGIDPVLNLDNGFEETYWLGDRFYGWSTRSARASRSGPVARTGLHAFSLRIPQQVAINQMHQINFGFKNYMYTSTNDVSVRAILRSDWEIKLAAVRTVPW
ncbi:MAG: hypothetical protein HRU46_07520 [Verrucomicrobiales bacterium]|nr:hypothetical protein [Verrucomicrobiales bacterium]